MNDDLSIKHPKDVPFVGVRYGYGRDGISDADMLVDDVARLRSEIYRHLIYLRIMNDVSSLKRPVVIGINGVDTSGKTMLSQVLDAFIRHRGIQTMLVCADDFHHRRSIRMTDDSPEGYITYAFDVPRLYSIIQEFKQHPKKRPLTCLTWTRTNIRRG